MRRISLLLLTLAVTACARGSYADADLLKNPLYAEFYYDDLVETMVQIQLSDPSAKNDERLLKVMEDVRRTGLARAQEANDAQDIGSQGRFIQGKHFAQGEALFTGTVLYLSPDFVVSPGPELHVFFSKDVDPRDVEVFPGTEDIDIGLLQSPYGAQQYATPELDVAAYRSLVIYDTVLKRLYAFAQLAE